jgi:long-chain acyl-CoA synthetase
LETYPTVAAKFRTPIEEKLQPMSATVTLPEPALGSRPVLTDFFGPVVQEHGDRQALRWRQGYRHYGLTFTQMARAIQAAARRLTADGVQPGDRVLLSGPSGPTWVVSFFGIVLAGGVVVPLDESTRTEFATEVGRRTGARLQIVQQGFAQAHDIPVRALEDCPLETAGEFRPFEAPPRQADDLLEIVYTSGTTSQPKGVMLTHGNVIANVASLRQAMDWPPGSRFLSVLPLSHMLGQVVGLFVPLRFGGTMFFAGTRRPSVLRDCFRRERITVLVTVPAFLDRIRQRVLTSAAQQGRSAKLERALGLARYLPYRLRRWLLNRLRRDAFPDLEYVFVGGAALRPDVEDFFHALGIRVLQGYGMTEASPVITCNTVTHHRAGTVGRAIPSVEVRTSPEGEILVRGPNVTPGYLDDSAATHELLQEGWLHTGDLGTADADGYWRILGRQKDVIIGPSGLNIYPEDIENVLRRLPGVRDACVVGLEQEQNMRLVGFVLLEEQATWDAQALLARANDELASNQRLQAVERWPEPDFPRGRTLKVKRNEVLARLERGVLAQTSTPVPAAAEDNLLALIRECRDLSPSQPIEEHHRLTRDLGLDSLGRLDLLSRIEERLGIELPESSIDDSTTVADLRRQLAAMPAAAVGPSFPRWARRPFWAGARRLLSILWRPLFRFYLPLESRGQEHLESVSGPVILIANHTSNLDTPAILAALPARRRRRVAVAAAADYWFNPRLGILKWLPAVIAAGVYNAFPFSRSGAIEPSLRYLGELIDEGWSILIYPEGTRSSTGQMVPFKGGIGLIARTMQVPIVPAALSGCFEALPKHRRFPRPARLCVQFGEPYLPPFTEDAETIAAQLEQHVRGLVAQLPGSTAAPS